MDLNAYDGKLPSYVNSYTCASAEDLQVWGEYDVVLCFEVVEHVDKTENLLQNCYDNLKDGGMLCISHPNLASLYARFELLFGFQPHELEPSNRFPIAGAGIFGKMNSGGTSIHHIRGITHKAMKEMLAGIGFQIEKVYGHSGGRIGRFLKAPSIAGDVLYICRK